MCSCDDNETHMGINKSKLKRELKGEEKGNYEAPFSIRLPKDLLEEIEEIAKINKTTKAKVIVKALRIALEKSE